MLPSAAYICEIRGGCAMNWQNTAFAAFGLAYRAAADAGGFTGAVASCLISLREAVARRGAMKEGILPGRPFQC